MKYVSPQTEKRKQQQKKRKKQLALCVCLVAFIAAVVALVAVFVGDKDAPDSSSQPNSEVVESIPENTETERITASIIARVFFIENILSYASGVWEVLKPFRNARGDCF